MKLLFICAQDAIDADKCNATKWSKLKMKKYLSQTQVFDCEPPSIITNFQSFTAYALNAPQIDVQESYMPKSNVLSKQRVDTSQTRSTSEGEYNTDKGVRDGNKILKEKKKVDIPIQTSVNSSEETQKTHGGRSAKIRGGAFAIKNAIRGIRSSANSQSPTKIPADESYAR